MRTVEWVTTTGASVVRERTATVTFAALGGPGGGVSDHGALTGLTDDDHPQYALADGTRGTFEVAGAVAAHVGAADPHPTYTTAAELAAYAQPLDSDLTAIAALTTTTFGRALLALADAAAGRSTLGLGTAATSNTGDFDPAGAATNRVLKAGDTMTGALLITGADATNLFRAMVTGNTNDRAQILSDGRARFIQRDTAMPAYTGVNRPVVYVESPQASNTTLVLRASSDGTLGNQLIRMEDYLGAPIAWVGTTNGFRITDALAVINGVFTITEQAGFFFRNSGGSGAILTNLDTVSLVLGVSSQVWDGDPVPSGKTLGNNISRSSWVFTGSTTNASNVVDITAGLTSGTKIAVGSTISGTGIPNGTTVTATTTSTVTISATATATGSGLTIRVVEPDTLAIRAYNGVEIHGRDTTWTTAAGKITYDDGLILSGDNDPTGSPSGWKVVKTDKRLEPPTNNTTDIGSSSKRARAIYTYSVRANNVIAPQNGVANVDIGETTNHFRAVYADTLGAATDPIPTAYVTSLVGTVNEGWTTRENAWTRVTDTQFTVGGTTDQTARYSAGLKVSWVQNGTTKYGVVWKSSFAASTTTVDLIPTSDYVLTSGQAITSERYSRWQNPQGFPQGFTYATTHTGFSANPTHYARWRSLGGNVLSIDYRCSADGTSNATTYTVTAPVASTGNTFGGVNPFWGTPNLLTIDASIQTTTPGRADIGLATSTVTVRKASDTTTAWTATGGKRVIFTNLIYEF